VLISNENMKRLAIKYKITQMEYRGINNFFSEYQNAIHSDAPNEWKHQERYRKNPRLPDLKSIMLWIPFVPSTTVALFWKDSSGQNFWCRGIRPDNGIHWIVKYNGISKLMYLDNRRYASCRVVPDEIEQASEPVVMNIL
jgi:hypothetical protein